MLKNQNTIKVQDQPKFSALILALWSLSYVTTLAFPCLTVAQAQVLPVSTETSTAQREPAPQADEIDKKIVELNDRLKTLQQAEKEQKAAQLGVAPDQLQQRIADLTEIISAYEQKLSASRVKQSLQQEQQLLSDRQKALQDGGISQKPPHTLTFYDSAIDDLEEAEQRKESAELAIRLSKQAIESLDERKTESEAKWRLLNEKKGEVENNSQNVAGSWEVEEARIQLELSNALLLLEKSYLSNHLLEQQIAQQGITISKLRLNLIRGQLAFDEEDLTKQIESLESRKAAAGAQLQKATAAQKDIEKIWLRTVKRFQEGQVSEGELQAVESRRKSQQTLSEMFFDTQRMLVRQQDFWRYRYALLKEDTDAGMLDEWQDDLQNSLTDIQRAIKLQQNYQIGLQSQIATIEKERSEKTADERLQRALGLQMQSLKNLANQRQIYMTVLIATEQLGRKLRDELADKRGRFSIGQRFSEFQKDFKDIWNYEVLEIDNRPVTIRKIIVSIIILVVGIIMAKLLIFYLVQRILKFARFRESTVSTIRKMISFAAYLLVFLFALRMVNIPLAAFAFLGGAVAIGVGFGAQNLINNFISGFIIMGERPIKTGDLVEVDSILGQVEEVGARCTRVRTGENIRILVPNSSLLEKNIINWTLSDRMIRTSVSVGVAYGSPVKDVEKLLLQATAEEPRVIQTPTPFVLFNDFGDNALAFSVYFWIQIKKIIERREIESRLRFRIDELFRKADIVIAFPQRDIHLDTQGPIEFRMVDQHGVGKENKAIPSIETA